MSELCLDNVCKPSCGDGIKNGTETDVDCGGTCPKCVISKACASNGDCLNDTCLGGVCFQASCAGGARSAENLYRLVVRSRTRLLESTQAVTIELSARKTVRRSATRESRQA